MRVNTPWVLILLIGVASAQQNTLDSKSKRKRPATKISGTESPVTQAEARVLFSKSEAAIREVLGIKGMGYSDFKPIGTVASRGQIIMQMSRLVDLTKPKFSMTPVPIKPNLNHMHLTNAVARAKATKLAEMGFIPPSSPLMTNKGEGISPAEFGDALGYFLARVAELTHQPSSKFTPFLSDPAG